MGSKQERGRQKVNRVAHLEILSDNISMYQIFVIGRLLNSLSTQPALQHLLLLSPFYTKLKIREIKKLDQIIKGNVCSLLLLFGFLDKPDPS